MAEITHVIKRSGANVKFNPIRIANAIYRAAIAVGGRDKKQAELLAGQVEEIIKNKFSNVNPPHVEEIQDIVEQVLIKTDTMKWQKNISYTVMSRTASGMNGIKNCPIHQKIFLGQSSGRCLIGLPKMISIRLQK